MCNLTFDFTATAGKIKPMNAVNNGPVKGGVRYPERSSVKFYEQAKIPYARNHDASFFEQYGGEHTVDVHRIFKYFDADETNPDSYFFEATDKYVKDTFEVGTKVFYRLGASIEHYIKYGTRVPKDYAKWARICEHIIKHYTQGWANGFNYDIEYWEIWNEPDLTNNDGSSPTWQGTQEQFIDFFEVVAKHLKKTFPNLKIGGPAFCGLTYDNIRPLLDAVKDRNIPLDFFSYHWYGKRPEEMLVYILRAREEMERIGRPKAETILDEWNYIRGWLNEKFAYSMKTIKGLKGSSFALACMCMAQANPVDMLMYYEGRPCAYNGFIDNEYKPLKSFHAFVAFGKLADLGKYVKPENAPDGIYSCGATSDDKSAMLFTYFDDNDDGYYADKPIAEKQKAVSVNVVNPYKGQSVKINYYLIDENNDLSLVKEEEKKGDSFEVNFDINIFSTYYIEICK